MKTITIKVEKKKNWADQVYIEFTTEKDGAVAEVDYPDTDIPGREKPRLYAIAFDCASPVDFDTIEETIAAAKEVCETYYKGEGYDKVEFDMRAV